jgi:hypothetical protein
MDDFIKTINKSKFSKIIWFVDIKDEEEIKSKINDRSDFVFVKTLEEFKKQINKNYYLVFQLRKLMILMIY